jgi:hypothetical protein
MVNVKIQTKMALPTLLANIFKRREFKDTYWKKASGNRITGMRRWNAFYV